MIRTSIMSKQLEDRIEIGIDFVNISVALSEVPIFSQ